MMVNVSPAHNILIDAICLFLLVFSFAHIAKRRKFSYPLVEGFILANIVAVLFEIASTVFKYMSGEKSTFLLYFFENGYNCGALVATGCWFLNSLQVTKNKLYSRKNIRNLFMLPLAVLLALTITTWIHQKVFFFNEAYEYMRGEWFVPFFGCAGLYLIAAFVLYLYAELNKENFVFKNLNIISAIYTFFLLACMGIQIITSGALSIINVACAVIAFLIHEDFQQKEITQDYLTGLPNRNALYEHMEKLIKSGKRFGYAIMLDVDLFKQINDRYGHLEGDNALIGVAHAMKLMFNNKAFYGRLAGDEFLILAENMENDEAASAESRINDCLKDILEQQGKDYSVTISAGYTRIDEQVKTIPEVLKSADDNLYLRKHEKLMKGSV